MKRAMYFFALAMTVLAIPVCTGTAWAAVPQQINYQGYLTDTGGSPLDTVVSMTFTLYDAALGTNQLWTETQPSCTVRAGLFNVLLGSVTAIPDSFHYGEVWLGITVGDNYEMTPRSRIVSVGYSYRVGTVDGASGGTISGDVNITGKANIGSGNVNSGTYAFVAGQNNEASGNYATINGGTYNLADNTCTAVGGGYANLVTARYGTISGGRYNRARGQYSVVGGGGGISAVDSNSAIGDYSTIAGGIRNTAQNSYAGVGGGRQNTANGNQATVSGGYGNSALNEGATVCGGAYNSARGEYSVVAGGGGSAASDSNSASGDYSVIGGGKKNRAYSQYAAMGGGYNNTVMGNYATVGGGSSNTANGGYATVGGGSGHEADGFYATVGGGAINEATDTYTTVSGGMGSNATGFAATVGGGGNNTASGDFAAVSGGSYNTASGDHSTIPGGGEFNTASGDYSFAAGRRAKANHDGAFVWADSTNSDFASTAVNQFNVRASGGVRIYTNSAANIGVTLDANDNTWNSVCDSTTKTNIRSVDIREMLDKVAQLPIKRWNFKDGGPEVEHISPMAQDFWNLFHVGSDSLKISTIDPAGIALAAIQELNKKVQEIDELRARNALLQAQNGALEERMARIELQLQQLCGQENNSIKQVSFTQTTH